MNVLIIEDNQYRVVLLQSLLKHCLQTVTIVTDSYETSNIENKDLIDYVLINQSSEEMTNNNRLQKIKKDFPYAKYILTSEHIENYKEQGFDDILQPPFISNIQRIFKN